MSEKRGRGQPKFEPTPDQRSQVKPMKPVGIPGDRILQDNHQPADQEVRGPDDAGAGLPSRVRNLDTPRRARCNADGIGKTSS
jgi:hypothetical protein